MLRMLAILTQIIEFILLAQMSFKTWAGPRPIRLPSIVPLSLFNLSVLDQSVCSWSLDLEIIIPLLFKRWIIQMFCKTMHLHSFFLWLGIDTHISSIVDHHIHCWIIIRRCPSYLITLWVLSPIHNAFGNLYPLLLPTMLCFRAGNIYSQSLWYMFPRYPDGLNLCLP